MKKSTNLHRYFRCAEEGCPKRWMVSYSLTELLVNFWSVMALLAEVECEVANHSADHCNEKIDLLLNKEDSYAEFE